jgi:kynurenine formamidase
MEERTETAAAIAALRTALAGFRVHDASPLIEPEMPTFVAHGAPTIEPVLRHEVHGAASNQLTIAEHTGTHVDAPFHFDPDGATVEALPADCLFLLPYKKFDLAGEEAGGGQMLGVEALRMAAARAGFELEPGDVAIVEFGWDRHWPGEPGAEPGYWGANEPGLDEDACRYLAEAGVAAVASDTAGCDVPCADGEIGHGPGHSTWFLPRGILVVEGLRGLAEVAPTGLIAALPLKIAGGTGSPLRVLLLDHAPSTDRPNDGAPVGAPAD